MSRWILVTGPGHGGTRLMTRVLARHPEVTLPSDHLTRAREYEPLHILYTVALDRMGLHEERLPVDRGELEFLLEAYDELCEPGRHRVLKMPHYPLFHLEAFADLVDLGAIVYVDRPVEKLIASNEKRGKDIKYLRRRKFLRQVKKCLAEDRKEILNARDFQQLIRAQVRACETLIDRWDESGGEPPVDRFRAGELSSSRERLGSVLERLDLDRDPLDEMLSLVDPDRVHQRGFWYRLRQKPVRLKNRLIALLKGV